MNHSLKLRHKITGPERESKEEGEIFFIEHQSLDFSNHLGPNVYWDVHGIDLSDFFFIKST